MSPAFRAPAADDTANRGAVRTSQELLYAARTDGAMQQLLAALATGSGESLAKELSTDAKRVAFWLNIYNAVVQAALKENAAQYSKRNAFFRRKRVTIAGKELSLDDIEHGILRRSRAKLSLGYFANPFPARYERMLRVERPDPRIHFALNCGARSCPPVAFYDDEKIDEQLDLATRGHLQTETRYDSIRNTIALPAFMGWFRADFGGKRGMRELLEKYGIVPPDRKPRITFAAYDWELYLDNYREG